MRYSKNGEGFFTNGDELKLNGTLASGATYVIIRSGIDDTLSTLDIALANTVWSSLKPNGDDGIALFKEGELLDVFGTEDRPEEAWSICEVPETSKDHVLRRKANVTGPTDSWAASSGLNGNDCQWDIYEVGEYDNIGKPTGK